MIAKFWINSCLLPSHALESYPASHRLLYVDLSAASNPLNPCQVRNPTRPMRLTAWLTDLSSVRDSELLSTRIEDEVRLERCAAPLTQQSALRSSTQLQRVGDAAAFDAISAHQGSHSVILGKGSRPRRRVSGSSVVGSRSGCVVGVSGSNTSGVGRLCRRGGDAIKAVSSGSGGCTVGRR